MALRTPGAGVEESRVTLDEQNPVAMDSVEELIRRQRQTEEIALRLFRFKTRRGIGVAYTFATVMVIFTLIAASNVRFIYPTLFLVAITPAVVILGSGLFGYRGVVRMNYAVALASGRFESERGYVALEILTIVILTWPWLVFTALENFGYSGSAYIFPPLYVAELFVFLVVGYRTRGRPTINWRIEDTIFFLSLCIASLLVIVPSIGIMGFEFALPVWILSGLKSLYEAPKEVVFEYESGRTG